MKRSPFILLVILACAFIFGFYHKILLNPDDYLFTTQGDAAKNYFTYAYHIKYDESVAHFTGMNYPYGELSVYTDCHYALTFLFKISGLSFFADHSIGILNFVMVFSIFLTFIVLFFLLKEFKINEWLALLFSLSITILSPQIFRLGGHFALSYSFAIPLSLLLMLRSLNRKKYVINLAAILLLGIFWIFIHAYLAIIITFFLFCIVTGTLLTDKSRRTEKVRYLLSFLVLFLPIIVFYFFAIRPDTHTGRMANPAPTFIYTAEADDIFVPNHPPLRPFLDRLTGNAINQKLEARSYVGLATTAVFVYILVLFLIGIFRKKDNVGILQKCFSSREINIAFISSLVVLMYAMAFPFRQFPVLFDIFPIIKSFRSTGRFTWPFYFMAGIFAAFVFQQILQNYKNKPVKGKIALLICIAAGLAAIAEGLPYHVETAAMISGTPNNYYKEDKLPSSWKTGIENINPGDYQAILPLPYYNIGSETFTRVGSSQTTLLSTVLSYHTGLPLLSSCLSRTSIPESRSLIQIISPDYYPKEIRNKLPSGKPILVAGAGDQLSKYENELLAKCKPIYSGNGIYLFSLDTADLFRCSAGKIIQDFQNKKENLYFRDNFLTSDTTSFLYYDDFDNKRSEIFFRGKGGFASLKRVYNTFTDFPPGTFEPGKDYILSAWMYNGKENSLNNWLRFIVSESVNDEKFSETATFFPEMSEVINGNWSLSEGTFRIRDPRSRVRIYTIGTEDNDTPIYIDDLLIREAGTDVYRINRRGDSLFYNNHLIKR